MTRQTALIHGLSGAHLRIVDPDERECVHCHRPFVARPMRLTCSDACRAAYLADWRDEWWRG